MNLELTNRTIEEMEEAIRAENDRRYAFYRMLAAADRVLYGLENLNEQGEELIPEAMRLRIRTTLAVLPASCLAVIRDSDRVQVVLDGVFDAQERLFRQHDPEWASHGDLLGPEEVEGVG